MIFVQHSGTNDRLSNKPVKHRQHCGGIVNVPSVELDVSLDMDLLLMIIIEIYAGPTSNVHVTDILSSTTRYTSPQNFSRAHSRTSVRQAPSDICDKRL